MADVFVLTGPQGSAINVASFVTEPGPDFGEQDLLKAIYSENPAAEGGVLAAEYVNVRRMAFPLRIASLSAFGGAAGVAAWLRTLARPGATLDVQLDGIPTAEAIRFDVNAGRYETGAWDTQMWQQSDRMEGTLKLDVQPYGYWPTMILLASAASVGGPGVLSLNLGGSIFGDVPGLAELFIAPTSATSYGDTLKTDSIYWSLGAQPSFQAWWKAASAVGIGSNSLYTPTLTGDLYAPASQSFRYWLASTGGLGASAGFPGEGWQALAAWIVPPSLEPAYRGRFRTYAWARLSPSQAAPFYASLDVQAGTVAIQALGSAALVATLPPLTASYSLGGGGKGASPAYSLLDLGEVTLPPVASNPYETQFRLWFAAATTNIGVAATAQLDIGGLYLLPLGGAAGALPRGILLPTWPSPSSLGRFFHSAITNDTVAVSPTSVVGSLGPVAPLGQHHRGVFPLVGASTIQLDLNLAGKQAQSGAPTGAPPLRSEPHFAQVSVRYRPRFATILKGL